MSDIILHLKDVRVGGTEQHPDSVTLEQAVVQIMRDSLRLEVDEQTHSEYVGGYDGRDMYEDRKTVKVTLWADIDEQSYKIDEIDFDA